MSNDKLRVMKIGIITFTVHNYGAQLQAYALQRKLSLMGYNVEICDVTIEPASEKIRIKEKRKEWLRALFSSDCFRTLGRLSDKLYNRKDNRIDKSVGKGFKEFKNQYLHCSPTYTADFLRKNPNVYDVYIVGSDQVWNYMMSSILDIYFLEFTKKQRISYAASFGINKIPNSLKKLYSKYLDNFDAISLREQNGVDMAKRLTKKEVVKVVDPTFLLSVEEWKDIFDNSCLPEEPYIFVYDLIDSNYLTDYVLWLSKNEDLKIVSVAGKTPRQFIALLANAKYVVTTSFHGAALAINFGVPFMAICRSSKSTNTRIIELCKNFGIDNHVLMEGEKVKLPCKLNVDKYRMVLDKQIQDSLSFIMKNIKLNVD